MGELSICSLKKDQRVSKSVILKSQDQFIKKCFFKTLFYKLVYEITINVPLFKKLRDIIFFLRDNNFLSLNSGTLIFIDQFMKKCFLIYFFINQFQDFKVKPKTQSDLGKSLDPNPHHLWKLVPDLHKRRKLDPDPHKKVMRIRITA